MHMLSTIENDLFLSICPSCHRNMVRDPHRRNCEASKAAKDYLAKLVEKGSHEARVTIIGRSQRGTEGGLPTEEGKCLLAFRKRGVKLKFPPRPVSDVKHP